MIHGFIKAAPAAQNPLHQDVLAFGGYSVTELYHFCPEEETALLNFYFYFLK